MSDILIVAGYIIVALAGLFIIACLLSKSPRAVANFGYRLSTDNNIWGNIAVIIAAIALIYTLSAHGIFPPKKAHRPPTKTEQVVDNIRNGRGLGTDEEVGSSHPNPNLPWRNAWGWTIFALFAGCGIFLFTRRDEVRRGYENALGLFSDTGGKVDLPNPESESLPATAAAKSGSSGERNTMAVVAREIATSSVGEAIGVMMARMFRK